MKFLEINDENLKLFLKNLRLQDRLEVNLAFRKDEDIIALIKKQQDIDFISFDGFSPLAIGGVSKIKENQGLIWLLTSNEAKKSPMEFVKFLDKKIEFYKKKYDVLYNFIFKSNFSFLPYLKKRGFKIKNLSDKDFKLFYFTKGGKF